MSWEPLRFEVVVEVDTEALAKAFEQVSRRLTEELSKSKVELRVEGAGAGVGESVRAVNEFQRNVLALYERMSAVTSEIMKSNNSVLAQLPVLVADSVEKGVRMGIAKALSSSPQMSDFAGKVQDISKGVEALGREVRESGQKVARAVQSGGVDVSSPVSYLIELATGGSSARLYRKFAEGLAEYYREVYGGGRPYLSLEGVTRISEMLSSTGFEEFLVGLGGGRARWGFWKAFLDISKFFFQYGFSSVMRHIQTAKTGGEVDENKVLEGALKSFRVRTAFFLGKMVLALVGMQTLVEVIVGRMSRISGVMGAIEGMMHATYVMAIKPLADVVGLLLLPFVKSILVVSILFYKNIGIPLLRATLKIERALERVHGWLASHIGETGANLMFSVGGLLMTTLAGVYVARILKQVLATFFGSVMGQRLLSALPGAMRSAIGSVTVGTRPFALGFPGGTVGAVVAAGAVGVVAGAELAKTLGGGVENISRGFQNAYRSSMRFAEQTRGLTSALFIASEGLFKYSGELYRLGVQTERAGGVMHRFAGLLEQGLGLLGGVIGNIYYGAGRVATGVEGGLRRLRVEVGLHFDSDLNLRGEVERVIRDAFGPAF